MPLETTIDAAAQKLIEAAEKFGPQATDTLLATGRVIAQRDLYLSFLQGGLALSLLTVFLFMTAVIFKRVAEDKDYIPALLGSGFMCCAMAIVLINALFWLCDPVLWVGLSRPEVYLAAKALKL